MRRFFLLQANHITKVDVDQYKIKFGAKTFNEVEFVRGPFYPPVDRPSDTYDLVTGISVMTHLPEAAQQIW